MLGTTARLELAFALFLLLLSFVFAPLLTVFLPVPLLAPVLEAPLFASALALVLSFFLLPPVRMLLLPMLLPAS